jgi:hypothetical protein
MVMYARKVVIVSGIADERWYCWYMDKTLKGVYVLAIRNPYP